MKNYAACIGADWGHDVVTRVDTPLLAIDGAGNRDQGHHFSEQLPPKLRYVFFLNWSWIVPKEVLDAYECVNFHCTALPFGRGGGPIENMIKLGMTDTVMTAHRMVEEIDAGPIYARNAMPISLAGTKDEILARFVEPVSGMVQWIIDNEPETYPQIGDVVEFKRLPKKECEALWKGRG